MGTRIKTANSGKIESLDDVNMALKDIGLAQKELDAIDAKANVEIAKIKEKALKDGESLRTKITESASKIQSYAEYNKDELFKDAKSIELSFGKIGYRKSTKISVKKTTLEMLKRLLDGRRLELAKAESEEKRNAITVLITKIQSCIRVKEEANKESLGLMDDAFLKTVGASRKITNDFFCEANIEEVNKDLLTQGA